jgi:hypothetical protein
MNSAFTPLQIRSIVPMQLPPPVSPSRMGFYGSLNGRSGRNLRSVMLSWRIGFSGVLD